MPPPFSQLFRKIGGDPSAESAGNKNLECGHASQVLQTQTASGHQSSPSRVYLPETQSVLASTVPRTLTPSREDSFRVRYNGQHGSTAQLPLTPSGPSRVIGYLPRTICADPSPFFGSTRLIIPSQPPQNACNEECMGNSGPQCRSTSISRTGSGRSLSPMSPFDPWKHGQALGRLEAHGSLKTVLSSQQEGGTLTSTSVLWSGTRQRVSIEVGDHADTLRNSQTRQPESGSSADIYGTSDQQSGIDLSLPPIQYLPNTVYQPVVLNRGDPSTFANLPYSPKVEGGQSFREALASLAYPLPNAEANNSSQATQQALHWSQVLPKPRRVLSSKSTRGETIVVNASSPSSGEISENGTVGNLAKFPSTCTESSEQRRLMRVSILEHARQARTIIQSPMFQETDEYLWSPAPSEDDWEAPSAPDTPIPFHTPSDALRTSLSSSLASDSRGGLSRSLSYVNEHMHSLPGSPGNPGIVDSSLPHIDDLVPAGEIDLDSHSDFFNSSQQASTMGSRESSRILLRYSGIIADGASSRPMSEMESKQRVPHSLGDRGKTASSMLSSTNPGAQTGLCTNPEQIHEEYESNAGSEAFFPELVQNPSADAGPGSSQTSSSLSTDRYGGDLPGHKARSGIHTLPTTRARCHTPPLLFGKVAISGPDKSDTTSSNAPGSTMGRFDQNLRATRLKETGRLPNALHSLDEQDWETVSAETEARTHVFDSITFDTKTGSSLADNSDSGHLSVSKEMPYPFRSIKARPVMHHPAHPRHNYSFVLLKNSQTGDLVQVPQYEYASGGSLPNNNASSQLRSRIRAISTYQHPSPLQVEHTHPFTSSPPIIRFTKPSAISGENNRVVVQQSHLKKDSSNLGLSEDVHEVKEKQTQNQIYKTSRDALRVPRPAVNQSQHTMEYKDQSSTWFSTVSEVTSSEPSLPKNGDSLSKTKVWHEKGHGNGNPDQSVNKEVGSSLADADSLSANFFSRPVSLASSLIRDSDTTAALGQRLRKQAIQQDSEFDSQHIPADFHKSLARPLNRKDLAISTSNTGTHSRSYSAGGLRLQHRKLSLRRSRSSSESHSRLMDSPSTQKASALKLLSSDSDAQQITSSELLLRNPCLHSDVNDSQYNDSQQNVIERRSHQPKPGDVSIDDHSTRSSTGSRLFMRDGILHTDVPPSTLHHPVHGRKGPWDRIAPCPLRPRPHPKPLGPPLFQRPVARAESPHLHRIQQPPTTELLERHVLLSRVYLLPSMVVPPIALVYGHGYMDGLMRLHTTGQINGFRTTEKTIALCWGYVLSAICIFAVVIAMIIIPASA